MLKALLSTSTEVLDPSLLLIVLKHLLQSAVETGNTKEQMINVVIKGNSEDTASFPTTFSVIQEESYSSSNE